MSTKETIDKEDIESSLMIRDDDITLNLGQMLTPFHPDRQQQ